jgi:hypothetical protein
VTAAYLGDEVTDAAMEGGVGGVGGMGEVGGVAGA